MATTKKATLNQVKEFFSTPERPVTNQELIDLKKNATEGSYDEIAELVYKELNK